MKILQLIIFSVAALSVSAREREDLLRIFEKENAIAEKQLQKAMTTLELAAASGKSKETAETQLLRALDHKLRRTPDAAERIRILENFHQLSREIQKVEDTPRQPLGSLALMRINLRIVQLLQRQTAILMQDAESEQRWKRIAEAGAVIDGRKIRLRQGRAGFDAIRYGEKVKLEILLFPEDVSARQGRDFAVIRTDIPFSVNSNFLSVYHCELKNGQLIAIKKEADH